MLSNEVVICGWFTPSCLKNMNSLTVVFPVYETNADENSDALRHFVMDGKRTRCIVL